MKTTMTAAPAAHIPIPRICCTNARNCNQLHSDSSSNDTRDASAPAAIALMIVLLLALLALAASALAGGTVLGSAIGDTVGGATMHDDAAPTSGGAARATGPSAW